jgi:hypothetical protein
MGCACCSLTQVVILIFAWRDSGKGHNISVKTKTRTWDFWNMSLVWYPLDLDIWCGYW